MQIRNHFVIYYERIGAQPSPAHTWTWNTKPIENILIAVEANGLILLVIQLIGNLEMKIFFLLLPDGGLTGSIIL